MAEVTKLDKAFKEDAQEYSFNVESELFHHLPKGLQTLWKVETEQHFINGMRHMLENPNGGALLYVNRKSYEIGAGMLWICFGTIPKQTCQNPTATALPKWLTVISILHVTSVSFGRGLTVRPLA